MISASCWRRIDSSSSMRICNMVTSKTWSSPPSTLRGTGGMGRPSAEFVILHFPASTQALTSSFLQGSLGCQVNLIFFLPRGEKVSAVGEGSVSVLVPLPDGVAGVWVCCKGGGEREWYGGAGESTRAADDAAARALCEAEGASGVAETAWEVDGALELACDGTGAVAEVVGTTGRVMLPI